MNQEKSAAIPDIQETLDKKWSWEQRETIFFFQVTHA